MEPDIRPVRLHYAEVRRKQQERSEQEFRGWLSRHDLELREDWRGKKYPHLVRCSLGHETRMRADMNPLNPSLGCRTCFA